MKVVTYDEKYTEVNDGVPKDFVSQSGFITDGDTDFSSFTRSEAYYYEENNEIQNPTIVITQRNIYIAHQTLGRAVIYNTKLIGDQRTYVFKDNGSGNVEPGTYRHTLNGSVGYKGKITSYLTYS